MRNFSSIAKALSLSTLMALSVSGTTQAASITFGGATATDSSGLTSTFMDPLAGGLSDYFIETFDIATGDPMFPGSTEYTVSGFESECAVNSLNGSPAGVVVTGNANEIGIRQGSVTNVAAAPADDTTCYGYATNNGDGVASLTFDYTNLLDFYGNSITTTNTELGITYLGFYWGSVDNYNDFEFYSGGSLVTTISGTELLNQLGGSSGNQTDPESNVYVNIAFSIAEQFDTLVINTSGIAGEFDNIVVGLSTREIPVPAPTGIALFAFALVALGFKSRLRK